MDSSRQVERVFDAPGRTRLAIPGLKGSTTAARQLEDALRVNPDIHTVEASSTTGRVLILYADALTPDAVQVTVVRVHAEIFADLLAEIARPAAPEPPSLQLPDATPGAIAVGIAVSVAADLLLGGSIAGAVVAGVLAGAVGLLFAAWNRFAADTPDVAHGLVRMVRPRAMMDPRVADLVWPHAGEFARAVLYSAAAAVTGVIRIVALALSADLLLGGTMALPFGIVLATPGAGLMLLGLSLALTWVQTGIRHRSHVLWSTTGREIQHELRVLAYDRVQRLEMSVFLERRRGELLSVIITDIDNLEKTADASWSLMDLSVSSIALITAMTYQVFQAGLWVMVPIPILVGLSIFLYPKLRELSGRLRERSAKLAARASNQLEGIETIKSFNAEERELERLRDASAAYLAESQNAIEKQSGVPLLLEATILSGLLLTYWTNVSLTLGRGLSFGRFQALNHMAGHLMFPLMSFGMHIDNLGLGMASLSRALEVLEREDESAGDAHLAPLPASAIRGDITYRDVRFSYGTGRPVLRGVSLTFPAGSTTAVVGLSGSGKTTLVKLLLRLYGAHAGVIQIGGRDISTVSRRSLRDAIAVVSQDVYLFDRSVLENIRISRPEATEAEVVEAARIAQAHDFIMQLPEGYATRLSERGGSLSVGERQRLSIARAVLKDAPIMILDEATSSVDSNTEASISRALRKKELGHTVIMIAHRLATVLQADRIYALEDGEIIAEGQHETLIRQPGRYRSLWRDQTGESASD